MTLAPNAPVVAASAVPADMLDALLGVFSARGFDGASLAELSRACGRSKASLYHHFPGGKAQMIEVLVSRCAHDLDQRAFAPLRKTLDDDLAAIRAKKTRNRGASNRATVSQALDAFLDGFSGYLAIHQGHCLLATLALTQPDLLAPNQSTRLTEWLATLAPHLRGARAQAQSCPATSPGPAGAPVRQPYAACHGVGSLNQASVQMAQEGPACLAGS